MMYLGILPRSLGLQYPFPYWEFSNGNIVVVLVSPCIIAHYLPSFCMYKKLLSSRFELETFGLQPCYQGRHILDNMRPTS